jgi:hypothetical protein
MNDTSNIYCVCAQCAQYINRSVTAYDVIMLPDGNTVTTHHHGCTRIYLMSHSGYVIEEVLHAQERK